MIVRAGLSPDVWRGHPARGHSDGWCGHPACVFRSRENPVFRSSENPFSHALGRRIEHVNDVLGLTTDYYFDGANELAEYRGSGDGDRMRYTVHGVAYIDEHLMMMVDQAGTSNDRPYYYVQDRLYNVWAMIDRAGAILEGWCRHPARGCSDATCGAGILPAGGLPLIRESAGRGDMNNDTLIDADPGTDKTRMLDARDGVIWDPRA
ncbi:MAG: hypothetical protein HUU22_07340, partial [Phycisphaerae bacterium]|nr:hypothetical protein [Phycisphaerae bacterium]